MMMFYEFKCLFFSSKFKIMHLPVIIQECRNVNIYIYILEIINTFTAIRQDEIKWQLQFRVQSIVLKLKRKKN